MTKEELENLYVKEGKTFLEIGEILGVSNVTAKKRIVEAGISIRSHKENQKLRMGLKRISFDINSTEYVDEKLSIQQIANRHNVSTMTVRKRLIEQGVEFRSATEGLRIIKKGTEIDSSIIIRYQNGESINDLAEEAGLSVTGLNKRFRKLDVVIRNHKDSGKLAIVKGTKTKLERYGYPYYPEIKTSKGEEEIKEYLNSLGFNFTTNRVVLDDNLELDGYDPSINTAFEYCGLYWHSERFKTNDYHYQKMKNCERLGIRLFTIFEDEWETRKPQVKGFLRASLGKFDTRIYGRSTEVKSIESSMAYSFLEENHIQGANTKSQLSFGLFYDDKLVSVMTFGTHHRNNKDVVLNRMAHKEGIQIVGGSSKLLNFAKMNISGSIKSWSDNRWSIGNVYEKMGFELTEELRPDYSYVKGRIRIPKQSMQKKKVGIPEDQTEHEYCLSQGLYRIYDCGKKVWLLKA